MYDWSIKTISPNFIGFSDIFDEMEKMLDKSESRQTIVPSYPHYDIFNKPVEVLNEDAEEGKTEVHTFLRIAVAGVKKEQLSVKYDAEKHTLEVKCEKGEEPEGVEYLHQGIAKRAFVLKRSVNPDFELVRASTNIEPGCLIVEFRKKDIDPKADGYVDIE